MKQIKLFDPNKNKPVQSKDDITFSVDVCTIDEHNLTNVAYYDFEFEEWKFHTDTFVDYDNPSNQIKWLWYYPPFNSEDVNEFHNRQKINKK